MKTNSFLQRLGGILFHDVWRKLFAVVLACLLYLSLNIDENMRVNNVAVNLQLPEGVVNVGGPVPPVTLQVTGSHRALAGLSARAIRSQIVVPPGSYTAGEPLLLKFSERDFKVPRGIGILSVEPAEATVYLEPLISRRLPIQARFDSEERLSQEYRVDRVLFLPDEVTVTGPASQVNELRMVMTSPIPLDRSVVESFEYTARIRPPNDFTVSPVSVSAHVEIARKLGTRIFRDVPVRIMLAPEQRGRFHARLKSAFLPEILITGPEKQLAALKSADLKAYLDLSDLRSAGEHPVKVHCLVPSGGLEVRSITPAEVTVILQDAEKKEK
ncbi:MAG: hypothetical protein J6R85_00705 [Lentisphaeria bacterium]|nr:hypothetical protein [Lentisphaeria bacterium]